MKARAVSIAWPILLLLLMLASAPPLEHFLDSPDMGYQLSLGRLTLLGKFPFVDMLQQYGPLVTLTSAAGQWVHDSVLPEVLICSLGYCVALTCIYGMVARAARPDCRWAVPAALAASLAAWFVLARFYKWYYWCFPMLTLACLSCACGIEAKRRSWPFVTGCVTGIAFLYRHDLGAACLLTAAAVFVVERWQAPNRRQRMFGVLWLAGGFAVPLVCWLAVLAAMGGMSRCWQYFAALAAGTSGTTRHWRLPPPRWDWRSPLSNQSCRCQLLVTAGLSYAVAIFLGFRDLAKGTVPFSPTTAARRCPRKLGQSPDPIATSGGRTLCCSWRPASWELPSRRKPCIVPTRNTFCKSFRRSSSWRRC